MEGNIKLLLPVVMPVAAGIVVLLYPGFRQVRKSLLTMVLGTLALETVLVGLALAGEESLRLWQLTDAAALILGVDGVSRLFAVLTVGVWLLVGVYSTAYMEHEQEEYRFFGFYLIVLGVLLGLDFSGNLITMYVFYELMTLTSLPLVLHERTKEAVAAGLKYLFYSVAGAFLALFGIFLLLQICGNQTFTPGGVLTGMLGAGVASTEGAVTDSLVWSKEGLFLTAVFCILVGFGAKAGMFPLHGWLPTAHPVAPAPASAVLSGVITKSGVLAVLRVVYFVVGPEVLRGTWVQQVWIFLTLLTVFMGSMLAYKEPLLKKRLAYSTVSQVSYVLFGLSMLQPQAFVGALSHVVFHSLIKNALFLCAGAVIVMTGKTQVKDMRGLGRRMPVLLGCYTVVSLALVGIPPASGFI
ncbi:MAG: NADH dehydrogenase, partial [Lachnospiraceae bacterium]|nr:NADH dehydrogenase [Lachnospiraceae bacterium]